MMAGVPKLCVMSEKFVRWCWMFGSRIGCALEFPTGDASLFKTSNNSFVICLKWKQNVMLMQHIVTRCDVT